MLGSSGVPGNPGVGGVIDTDGSVGIIGIDVNEKQRSFETFGGTPKLNSATGIFLTILKTVSWNLVPFMHWKVKYLTVKQPSSILA